MIDFYGGIDMITREVEGSRACECMFRNTPELAALPQIAADRGLYSSFFVGISCVFFVFGYDKELIETGAFTELFTRLYATDEYNAEHRLFDPHNFTILRRRYNVISLGSSDLLACSGMNSTFSLALEQMNRLETIHQLAKRFHHPMPEYFDWGGGFGHHVAVCYAEINDARYRTTQEKAWNQLKQQFLYSCMTQISLRPTDRNYKLVDYANSIYCVGSDPMKDKKYLHHPEKWEKRLFAYTKDYSLNPYLEHGWIHTHLLDAFLRLLDLHQIPYRLCDEKILYDSTIKNFQTSYAHQVAELYNDQLVYYPAKLAHFVEYLYLYAFINTYFTAEEEQWALDLVHSGECYLFYCLPRDEYLTRLKESGIRFATHPILCNGNSVELVLVCKLEDKADIDEIIYSMAIDYSFIHDHSSIIDSASSELRMPDVHGGIHISVCADQPSSVAGDPYMGYSYTPAKRQGHEAEQYLREQGLLVDPLRSLQYEENQKPRLRKLPAGMKKVRRADDIRGAVQETKTVDKSSVAQYNGVKRGRYHFISDLYSDTEALMDKHPEMFDGLVCDEATQICSCPYYLDPSIIISGKLRMITREHELTGKFPLITDAEKKRSYDLGMHMIRDPELKLPATQEAYDEFVRPRFQTTDGSYVYTVEEQRWVNELLHRGLLVSGDNK